MSDLFVWATRNKVRFPFKGMVSVEDLWDLSVTNLDSIFKSLKKQEKNANEESLLHTKSEGDDILLKQIEIIKYIVNVKLEEKDNREKAALKREKKQKIMALMAKKDDENLEKMSRDDLQKLLDELD